MILNIYFYYFSFFKMGYGVWRFICNFEKFSFIRLFYYRFFEIDYLVEEGNRYDRIE